MTPNWGISTQLENGTMVKRLLAAGLLTAASVGVTLALATPASAQGEYYGKYPTQAKCVSAGKAQTDPPHVGWSYYCTKVTSEKTSNKWYLYLFPIP